MSLQTRTVVLDQPLGVGRQGRAGQEQACGGWDRVAGPPACPSPGVFWLGSGDLAVMGLRGPWTGLRLFVLTCGILVAQVVLRVLFPDRYILQGFFRPSETGERLQRPSPPDHGAAGAGPSGSWGSWVMPSVGRAVSLQSVSGGGHGWGAPCVSLFRVRVRREYPEDGRVRHPQQQEPPAWGCCPEGTQQCPQA